MIKLEIFRVLPYSSSCGAVNNVYGFHSVGHAFESRSEPFLIKIFTYQKTLKFAQVMVARFGTNKNGAKPGWRCYGQFEPTATEGGDSKRSVTV